MWENDETDYPVCVDFLEPVKKANGTKMRHLFDDRKIELHFYILKFESDATWLENKFQTFFS